MSQGPKAVLGPGTGLGEAQLFWDEIQGGYKVWPSEGSHSGFAPRGWKQRALQARDHSHTSPLQCDWNKIEVICDDVAYQGHPFRFALATAHPTLALSPAARPPLPAGGPKCFCCRAAHHHSYRSHKLC